jgi:hypothetical protein
MNIYLYVEVGAVALLHTHVHIDNRMIDSDHDCQLRIYVPSLTERPYFSYLALLYVFSQVFTI